MIEEGFSAIQWQNGILTLLDQRYLPLEEKYVSCSTASEVAQAITQMVVRGAPAIGIAAAYGVVLAAQEAAELSEAALEDSFTILAQSRPTAVNLFWALDHMRSVLRSGTTLEKLEAAAITVHEDDKRMNITMAKLGADLLQAEDVIYTHCNTGGLATGGTGTALGVIKQALATGGAKHVYAGETRPWMQGSRLTMWELKQANLPSTLVTEGAASWVMKEKGVTWVIVGADRIAANGDTANKVGTYNLAVLARHHGAKFMVVAPSTTFDLAAKSGQAIPIELRDQTEVTHIAGKAFATAEIDVVNPAFDVTPAELIDAIVTEQGVIHQPTTATVAAVLGK